MTAATLLLEASVGHTMTGSNEGMWSILDRARAAAAQAGGVPEVVTHIMVVVSGTVDGTATDVRRELAALEPQLAELPVVQLGEPVGLLAQTAVTVEDFARARRIIEDLLARQRQAGAIGTMPFPLSVRAILGEREGRWDEARPTRARRC